MTMSKKCRQSKNVTNSIKRHKTVKRRKTVKKRKIIITRDNYIGGVNNSDEFDPDEVYNRAMITHIADKSECSIEAINLNKGVRPVNLNAELPSNFKLEQSGAGGKSVSSRKLARPFIKQKQFGGGEAVLLISDITQSLVDEFKRVSNCSDSETKSLSIFNPSITWLRDDAQVSYYCCTSRCIIYMDNTTNRPVTEEFVNRSYADMKPRMEFFNGGLSNNPDKTDERVRSNGSVFNKWFTTGGFWGEPLGSTWLDVTMITMIKIDFDAPVVAPIFNNSRILGSVCGDETSPIDARVLNIFTDYTSAGTPPTTINTVYITGNRNGSCVHPTERSVGPELTPNHVFPIDPETVPSDGYPAYNGPMIDGGEWKQSLTRVQIVKSGDRISYSFPYQPDTTGRDPFAKLEKCTESALANCISWYQNTEKNYALFYFDYEHADRTFCPGKCMILNYSMTSRPSNKRNVGGMVFYYKPFDSRVDDPSNINSIYDGKQFEEGDFGPDDDDNEWKTIQLPNSDIFNKIKDHFANCKFKVSCTTPFMKWGDSLIAVGHIKVNIFKHLNNQLMRVKERFGTDYDKIINYYADENVDRLFTYGINIIRWIRDNVMNHPIHGYNGDRKYLVRFNQTQNEVDSQKREYLIYQFLTPGYEAVRAFLMSEGFIKLDEAGKYITTRNLHPSLIYFMFFYKINANTLSLESFSDFFILNDTGEESFLNFPMGITQSRPLAASVAGEKSIVWVSYGAGDCRCKIASFTPHQIDTLISYNKNDDPIQNINFVGYNV